MAGTLRKVKRLLFIIYAGGTPGADFCAIFICVRERSTFMLIRNDNQVKLRALHDFVASVPYLSFSI